MTDFKVGDRVVYTGLHESFSTPSRIGWEGEVTGMLGSHPRVRWDNAKEFRVYPASLRHVAPDVITINRADLPEVVADAHGARVGPSTVYDGPWARKHAMTLLAQAEFLEARDKAAEDAERSRDKRRDELAAEVAKAGCYVAWPTYTYKDHDAAARAAIDMIIDLEASHD